MKIRTGFVSNSSSASFSIPRNVLTDQQAYQILNHSRYTLDQIRAGNWEGGVCACDDSPWDRVCLENDRITGRTMMDNFDMNKFFILIGVSPDYIQYD